MDCPSFETLLKAAESAPDGALSHHLEGGCTVCAERLETARLLLRVLRAAPLEEVPAELHRRAVSIGEVGDSLGQRIHEWVARLVTPPAATVPAFRGTAPVQRLYRAGPYEVDASLLPDGVLVGQLTHESEKDLGEGGYCVLYSDGAAMTSSLSEDGEFRFEGVTPGAHVLVVRSGDSSVVIPDLELDFS